MKIALEITPDDTLTEHDFAVMCERASEDGETPDEWAAKAIRKALYSPRTPVNPQPQEEALAA